VACAVEDKMLSFFFFFLSGRRWKKSEAGANRLTNS